MILWEGISMYKNMYMFNVKKRVRRGWGLRMEYNLVYQKTILWIYLFFFFRFFTKPKLTSFKLPPPELSRDPCDSWNFSVVVQLLKILYCITIFSQGTNGPFLPLPMFPHTPVKDPPVFTRERTNPTTNCVCIYIYIRVWNHFSIVYMRISDVKYNLMWSFN